MGKDIDVHLRWDNHHTNVLSVLSSLLDNENLVDCTIGAEGQYFKAHRVILSACSPHFELLFSQHYEKHPIVILSDVKFHTLKVLLEFMYSGEMRVPQDKLGSVLKLAETLQVKGLSGIGDKYKSNKLRHKRRNEVVVAPEQQDLTEYLHEPRCGTDAEQTEDGSLPHILKKKPTAGITSLPLATQECGKNSSSIHTGKTDENPNTSQDTHDTGAFNPSQSSPLTETLSKSSCRVSEALLTTVPNILGTTQLPEAVEGNISVQRVPNENVFSTCSSKSLLRSLESQATTVLNTPPDIMQDGPNDFNGHTVEEIILDEEGYEHDYVNSNDNSTTVGEEYMDTFFVDPSSILPNRFKCSACAKSYRQRQHLARHLKYECGKKPQFKCPHCPMQCSRKDTLNVHIARFHLHLFALRHY